MRREALLITALIILSGCTTTGGGGSSTSVGSSGVVIDEFSSDFAVIEEGDVATLLVSFTNVDDEDATKIWGKVYTTGLSIIDTDSTTVSTLESKNSDFFISNVQAPTGIGVDRKYRPYAEICYDYSNSGSTSAFVIDQDVYTPGDSAELSSHSDSAPIQLYLTITQEPIKILGSREKTLTIALTNVDKGNVYNETGTTKVGTINRFPKNGLTVRIPITISSTATVDPGTAWTCTSTIASKTSEAVCTNNADISFGRAGEGNSISLDMNLTIEDGQEDIIFFIAEANYRYCIETDPILITATAAS
jgi:hypothetical protein